MKNEKGSSRLDTVLKMLLIAFISLLAFSSGVYFGKQMSDSDYQLKALEGDFNNAKKTAENDKEQNANGEEALVDEEVAQLTDKYMKSEKQGPQEGTAEATADGGHDRKVASAEESHGEATKPAAKGHGEEKVAAAHEAPAAPAPAPAAKTAQAKPDLSAAHQAAARVASNHAPTEAAKPTHTENRAPSSLPKTVGTSNDVEFTVQVASYPTAEAAKEHAAELVKKGFPAFPVEAAVNGRVWYRVSVGSFKTMKDATTYRAQLLKQADLPSAIVQRIQR